MGKKDNLSDDEIVKLNKLLVDLGQRVKELEAEVDGYKKALAQAEKENKGHRALYLKGRKINQGLVDVLKAIYDHDEEAHKS